MQAGVVEEVVVVALRALAVGSHLDHAGRHRLERELVVDGHGEPQCLPGLSEAGEIGLERRVATLVLDHQFVVDPHGRAVRRGIEPEDDALPNPAGGDVQRALVPDVTDEVVEFVVDEQIVEAGRHGNVARLGEWTAPPPGRAADECRIRPEPPDAVEAHAFTNPVVLWPQHPCPLNARKRLHSDCRTPRRPDARPNAPRSVP